MYDGQTTSTERNSLIVHVQLRRRASLAKLHAEIGLMMRGMDIKSVQQLASLPHALVI